MKLQRLTIRRLPGLKDGIDLQSLEPGINLVVGPNASGKSSLVRALRLLMGGVGPHDRVDAVIEAELVDADGTWQAARTGRDLKWRLNGADMSDGPGLPGREFLHCYWLSVEDLLSSNHDDDKGIVEKLRRELTGGYDVRALLKHGAFSVGARHGSTEERGLREARKALSDVERDHQALQQDRERLSGLEMDIAGEADVRLRLSRAAKAQELLKARRERISAEQARSGFSGSPDEMLKLLGDEQTRLGGLEENREGEAGELKDAERRKSEADEEIRSAGLKEEVPSEEQFRLHRRTLTWAHERFRDRRDAVEARNKARAAEESAVRDLGGEYEGTPDVTLANVAAAESLADRLEGAASTIRELEARITDGGQEPDAAKAASVREAVAALRAWITVPGPEPERALVLSVGLVVAAVVAVAALLGDRPGVALLAVGSALVVAIALVIGAVRLRQARGAAKARFAEQSVRPPKEWALAPVQDCLRDLEKQLAELTAAETRWHTAEADRARLAQAQGRLSGLENEKRALAEELGFDPAMAGKSIHQFAQLVHNLRTARQDAAAAAADVREADENIRGPVLEARTFLEQWPGAADDVPAPDALEAMDSGTAIASMESALDALETRADRWREARAAHDAAVREIERFEAALERIRENIATIYTGVGLPPGDRQTLAIRLRDRSDFLECHDRFREAKTVEASLEGTLEGEVELLAVVEDDDELRLVAIVERLESELQSLEDIKEERTQIQTRVEDAGQDRRLEEATAAVEGCRAALEDARAKALEAAAGKFLLEEVREAHRAEHEPVVFGKAREQFEGFTHHQWSLELTDDGQFAARDLSLNQRRELTELSSGTRMQLLLAVRMAWTRELEKSTRPLPLFLDEALTTSDPSRFALVARSLAQLAEEEDRQIFYMAAQPSDVHFWESALGRRLHVIDLQEVQGGERLELSREDFTVPERRRVPPPDGDDPAAYAVRLGTPLVDPWADPGTIPLFHIIRDDLRLLHELMDEWRIETLGQLDNLLRNSRAAAAIMERNVRERLQGRSTVIREWVEAWRFRRDRPVDRAVLERSPLASSQKFQAIVELADQLGGDPRRLVEEMPDISGVGATTAKKWQDWLEAEGCLLEGDPMDASGRESQVLLSCAGILTPEEIQELVGWLEAGLPDSTRNRASVA